MLRASKAYRHSPVIMVFPELNQHSVSKAMSAGVTETFSLAPQEPLNTYLRRFGDFRKDIDGRVLLVEDSISQQQLAKAVLEDVGLLVDTAVDVSTAWQLFLAHEYDLVLSDLVLVGEDTGMALVQKIRRLDSEKGDIPIIVMSSYDDDARRVELYRYGVNEFIRKPIFFEELVARTRYLVMNSKLSGQVLSQKLDLEKKNRSLNEFIGRFSHEFRNSINVELGVSKVLLKDRQNFSDRQIQLVELSLIHI